MTPAMRRAGLFMLVLGCTASAVAAQPPPAEDFLRRSEAGWQAVAATEPGSPARIAACDAQAEAGFDMAALARLVAGDFIWLRLGASLQPRFVAALRSRLVTDCTRRQGAGTLALLASRPRDGGVSVTARWHAPGSDDRTLVWRLRPGGPWGWQASDVAADGVSLSAVLHEEVRAAFDAAGGDPDAAIAGLARGAPLP
jgi:hypothetical protein